MKKSERIRKVQKACGMLFGHRYVRLASTLAPLLFALIGYGIYYAGEPLFTLFSAIRVYVASFDAGAAQLRAGQNAFGASVGDAACVMRVCLEIARWGGLLVTGTFFFKLLSRIAAGMNADYKIRHQEAVGIHGSEHYKLLLGSALGDEAITQDVPEKFAARRHILAFDEDRQTLEYLSEHLAQFPGMQAENGVMNAVAPGMIYLCVLSSSHTKYSSEGFVVNNMAEDCARLYWKRHYIRLFSGKPERKVVLLGFGHYGQALLGQALMVNVFLRDQPGIEYHVFGDSRAYRCLHPGIERFARVNPADGGEDGDVLVFHDEPWEESLPCFEEADRIILCDDSDETNIRMLSWLVEHRTGQHIHIRIRDERMIEALYPEYRAREAEARRITAFGTDRSLYTRELILDEELLKMAKRVHARYLHRIGLEQCRTCPRYDGRCSCIERCPQTFDESWNNLGVFLQRSNICVADHMDVKLRQVLRRDCEVNRETLEAYKAAFAAPIIRERLDEYLELEHRRWMRYHFFNGWTYSPEMDRERKKHNRLVPYEELPAGQRSKDLDAYEMILDLNDPEKGSINDVYA